MSPSTESTSKNGVGARDGLQSSPKHRLDALPAELLKLIVVLVKEQDERLAQPLFQRHSSHIGKGIQALSRVSKALRAAVMPFLRQVVTPNHLAHPLFQYGRIPIRMLQAVKVLDCSEINSGNAVPATTNLERLCNLHSVRVNCTSWDALGWKQPNTPEPEYDDDGEEIPPTPVPEPPSKSPGQLAEEAFGVAKSRFSAVRLDQVAPLALQRHFSTFVDTAVLRQLSLSPWTQFYDRGAAPFLAPLESCRHLVSLHLSDHPDSQTWEPEQPDWLVRLPWVEELSICSKTPRVIRVIEHMTPNVRSLCLSPSWGKVPADFTPASLPHLVQLRIHAHDFYAHAFSAFVNCPYQSATWTDPRRTSIFSPDQNLAEILPFDNFPRTLRFLRIGNAFAHAASSSIESYQAMCATRGVACDCGVARSGIDFLVKKRDNEIPEKASSVREVLRWAQDRVDWLERLGDEDGLQDMARRVQDLERWQVVERV